MLVGVFLIVPDVLFAPGVYRQSAFARPLSLRFSGKFPHLLMKCYITDHGCIQTQKIV